MEIRGLTLTQGATVWRNIVYSIPFGLKSGIFTVKRHFFQRLCVKRPQKSTRSYQMRAQPNTKLSRAQEPEASVTWIQDKGTRGPRLLSSRKAKETSHECTLPGSVLIDVLDCMWMIIKSLKT